MHSLRPIERLVLDTLLAGEDRVLVALRRQASDVRVSNRTHTTVGEYVDLQTAELSVLVDPPNIVLEDIDLEVEGVTHGVATLLYVVDGRLSFIEFATAAEEWPTEPIVRGATYLRAIETGPESYALEPSASRDQAWLRRALRGRGTSAA
jgi:hypothetical protein